MFPIMWYSLDMSSLDDWLRLNVLLLKKSPSILLWSGIFDHPSLAAEDHTFEYGPKDSTGETCSARATYQRLRTRMIPIGYQANKYIGYGQEELAALFSSQKTIVTLVIILIFREGWETFNIIHNYC